MALTATFSALVIVASIATSKFDGDIDVNHRLPVTRYPGNLGMNEIR
jgi:hypothetical protein